MARRTPPNAVQNQSTGGASGAPEDHQIPEAITKIVIPGQAASRARLPERPVHVPVKRFEVERGGRCMLDGCLVPIQTGRIITELQYDVERLRAQNIVLKQLPPTPEDVAAMEAEAPAEAASEAATESLEPAGA